MAGARAEHREETHAQARAEQLLLVDVADAFYLLLEQREDLRALETIRTSLLERIDDLKARERLGRSRPSEGVSAEAQLRRVEAEHERVLGQEAIARHLLEFLTGRAPLEAIQDLGPSLPALQEEAAYRSKANARPDVRAAEEAWGVARHQVSISKADYWPDVDLEGNYYTKRAGAAEDVDWDVLVKVHVPIFMGGQTTGAVREAKSLARQARLRFEQTQRQAVLDIQDAYVHLDTALKRTAALEQALQAAEEDYRLQGEDYRLNLVSNLDVLKALQALEDARRDVIHARYEAKRRHWQLRVATGDTL